jgi:hypothetical protein
MADRQPIMADTPAASAPAAVPVDLAIVVLNYNTAGLLRDCLASVFASQGDLSYQVWVVDNASTDGSLAMLRAEFPAVHLVANQSNVGYSAGNNVALRRLGFRDRMAESAAQRPPRYVLLLNPDTLVPPTALARMVAFMDARPEIGVAGPRVRRPDGSLDRACRRSFPTPLVSFFRLTGLSRLFPRSRWLNAYNLEYLPEDAVHPVDAVVGAFMLIRCAAIEQVGLLDESFFMYGEDLDWAKRITEAGWEVWYNPQVTVLHVKEAASRHSYRARVEFYRALTIFYEKHYRSTTAFWMDWLIRGGITVFGSLDLLKRRLRGQGPAAPASTEARR